ncbi:MAG: CapA family protein [Saprospiraceae bacterium]|nr:CapA family protein [Saprospiraceae bacterium]
MKKLPAVTAYTPEGKVLLVILRGLLRGIHFIMGKKRAVPPPFFHDDPRHYTPRDLLYFAYKYYVKPPEKHENREGGENFFLEHPPIFSIQNVEPESTITLTAAGDLMPYAWIQPQFCAHLWDEIGDDFFSADITFANLETPIDTSKPPSLVPEVMLADMLFNGSDTLFSIFNATNFKAKTAKRIGFDVLATANNHSLDMGEAGVYATIDFLKNKNIQHIGTALSPEESQKTTIIERNGIRLAFISYTFSMNQKVNPTDKPWLVNHLEVNQPDVDLSVLTQDIAKAKQQNADLVILSLHYGNAYQAYPCGHIVDNTKRIFEECGADIILGGHPHNIQPMAVYPFTCPHTGVEKRGFVLFSFGDFVAYDIFNWCHLPIYLKMDVGLVNSDAVKGKKQVILTKVEAVPVYVCGHYRSRTDRDLRFLDARKTLELIESGKTPLFMTDWNVRELRGLMQFYNDFFVKNL